MRQPAARVTFDTSVGTCWRARSNLAHLSEQVREGLRGEL